MGCDHRLSRRRKPPMDCAHALPTRAQPSMDCGHRVTTSALARNHSMTERTYRSKLGLRLGSIILRLRRRKRWTRYDLARRAGISENYVRLMEQGLNVPTLQTIVALADVLDTTPAEMVREATEEMTPPPPSPPPAPV
jgi:ribosome-binding protein aMBF1 (putative translation factor)